MVGHDAVSLHESDSGPWLLLVFVGAFGSAIAPAAGELLFQLAELLRELMVHTEHLFPQLALAFELAPEPGLLPGLTRSLE